MKLHRYLLTETGLRLYPTRFSVIFRSFSFHELAALVPLPGGCSFTLVRYGADPLHLVFQDAGQAARFSDELGAIIAPAALYDPTPLQPEQISATCSQLLAAPGQNIRNCLTFILRQGINHGSSDIMLAYCGERFEVSCKLDGLIVPIFEADADTGKRLINALKTAAGLLIYRSDTIQEGRLNIGEGDQAQDLRVSIVPAGGRERAVIRLFDRLKSNATLDDLGITPLARLGFRRAITAPGGLVLVCGPSGSGKTTTVYAALRELKQERGRLGGIITVEDPIEYLLEGIAQIEVDPVGQVSFGSAVRSVLRQDPSVLMIGEIRDSETADAAVTAALTGHLVVATLHAASAAEAVTRLLDLGVRPVMLNSVLKATLCQRLVRKPCSACSGKGCASCHNSGYQGRGCIAELLETSAALQQLIAAGQADSGQLERCAVDGGMVTLYQAALLALQDGATDQREVTRVTGC